MHEITLRTRQHRSGNSRSVRLPGVAAYPDPDQELEVIVRGDERVIRPVRVAAVREDRWPKPTMTIDAFFAWLDANGPSQIGDDAFLRGEGRPDPWAAYEAQQKP